MRMNTNALCLILMAAVISCIAIVISNGVATEIEASLAMNDSSVILSALSLMNNEHSRGTQRLLDQHDSSSLFTHMWHKGKPISPLGDEFVISDERRTAPVFDTLSIGSQFNVPLMEAQSQSWASTPFVRYLFGATEQDDADPECHLKLNSPYECFSKCSEARYNSDSIQGLRSLGPREKWMTKSNKTIGWVCAQQRFAHAVGKIGRFYRREGPQSLPDFLLIQDDDTWFGMNQIVSYLKTKNHTRPFVTPACTITLPIHQVNHTFPWGGFGLILNRLALERLFRPNYCNGTTTTTSRALEHEQVVCSKLNENAVGENVAFQEGFSVSDVMDRHATLFPYSQCNHWPNPGYCMLGDWVLGYYVNQYEIGSKELPGFLNTVHMGIELGNKYYRNGGACSNFNITKCRDSRYQYACHQMKPQDMFEMTAIDSKKPIDQVVKGLIKTWEPRKRRANVTS